MAINFPKLPKFGTADAKSRIFLIFAAIVGISIVGYILVRTFSGGPTASGPSRVANPAAGVQSVPGSKLSPEYYQALRQANVQATQQGQMTGGSAVPTMVNVPGQSFGGTGNCTVLCPGDDKVDVSNDINDLVKSGKLSQDEADKLNDLAKGNVPVDQYAAALDDLVRQGKLTPEQARKLLEAYKKQHANALIAESAQAMDGMIKAGQLPLDVANDLLALQKTHPTAAQYAAELDRLVREGKLTPEQAAQLLAQYTQQQQKEKAKQGAYQLSQMAKAGEITSAVAAQLTDLQNKNIPVDDYAAELQKLVAAGKLTPEAAAKLLDQYKKQRAGLAATSGIDKMLAQKEAAAAQMVKNMKLPQDTTDALLALQKKNLTPEEYQAALAELVKQGKLTPEQAQKLLANYKNLAAARAMAQSLKNLQGNNASAGAYADALKKAVVSGVLTPDQAAQLLQEYQAAITPYAPGVATNVPGADDFARLQQQLAAEQVTQPAAAAPAQFSEAEARAQAEAEQARQQRIANIESAMSAQAQQLVTAWQIPPMQHKGGVLEEREKERDRKAAQGAPTGPPPTSSTTTTTTTMESGPPLIKMGTILFAVLDTGVNSDYPDTPVMATIVSGAFKGAKLMGKVQTKLGPNQDKVSLTFTMMDMQSWPKTKSVNAFAIDPDTARTVMASGVDNHYMERYGATMATSFLQGYSTAIMQAGSTATTGVFGTTSTFPNLSPASKFAVGLGQIGTTIGKNVQKQMDRPITVTVDAGVGLGILFMGDVTQ